jgi:hypothetical protein
MDNFLVKRGDTALNRVCTIFASYAFAGCLSAGSAFATPLQETPHEQPQAAEVSIPPTIVTERSENTITETSDDNISDSLIVPSIASTVELDGIIDEAVWEEATKYPLHLLLVLLRIQRLPYSQQRAYLKTAKAYILHLLRKTTTRRNYAPYFEIETTYGITT